MGGEATRFRAGQSGNPGGRPRRQPVTDALVKELAKRAAKGEPTQAQQAAEVLVQLFLAGDVAAGKLVLAYVEGLPAQPMEHSGPGGKDLAFTLVLDRPTGGDDGDS